MALIEKLTHSSIITLVVRDGRTGEIKDVRVTSNMKVYGTMDIIASTLCNDPATNMTCCYLAVGTGPDVASDDTGLTGEVGGFVSRTIGRFSHDANAENWNLSWSLTAWDISDSIREAGIFNTFTGANLYLKATFAGLAIASQDMLYVAWKQSLASQ